MACFLLKVWLKTPVSLGRLYFYPPLDSVLLHRLVLLHRGDVGLARQSMPVERDGPLWRCGGGYDPGDFRFCTKALPRPYKVYRRLANDPNLADMAGLSFKVLKGRITEYFGQQTLATEYRYLTRDTLRLDFRFAAEDPELVLRILRLEPFLGPGHSVGLGEIDRMEIGAAQADEPGWVYRNPLGQLTRPVPRDWSDFDGLPGVAAVEPPYWANPLVPAILPYPVGAQ